MSDTPESAERHSYFYPSMGERVLTTSMDVYLPVRDDGYVETEISTNVRQENPLDDGWRWMKATIQFADLKELG